MGQLLGPRFRALLAPGVLALLTGGLLTASLSAQQAGGLSSVQDTAPTNLPEDNLQIWPSNGLGGISYGGFRALSGRPTHVFKGKFGSDTLLDVLVNTCNGTNCSVHVFPGTAGNTIAEAPITTAFPAGFMPGAMANAGDVNFDGIDDFWACVSSQCRLYGGTSNGTFVQFVPQTASTSP